MKIKQLIIASTLFLNTFIYAGDPCPISFKFYDAGVPPWLNKNNILNKLKSKKTWFGISYNNKENEGIVVTKVYKDSPAETSGIQKGDIIYAIDDKTIKIKDDFTNYIDNKTLENKIVVELKRENKKIKKVVTLVSYDPLLYKLEHYIPEYCNTMQIKELSHKDREEIYKKAFSSSHRFECKAAHKILSKMKKFQYDNGYLIDGQLIFIRGSKRIMLVQPNWETMCINSKDYDGKNLTEKKIKKLFDDIFAKYVKDRFENP